MLRLLIWLSFTAVCFGNVNLKSLPGMPFVNRTHRLGRGLVAMWMFNERYGPTVFDLSGNNYGIDFVNSPIWTPGNTGPAILFDDGSSQLLHRAGTCGITDYPFSMVCWFNCDDINANNVLMAMCQPDGSSDYHMLMARDPADSDIAVLTLKDGAGAIAHTSAQWSANTWHMATGVWEASNLRRAYLDDGNEAIDTTDRAWPATLNNTTIGARRYNNSDSLFMSGRISLALIYNRALSAGEVAELYEKGPSVLFEKDDIALMAVEEEPAPGRGQVIMITSLPVLFIGLYLCRKYKAA